jgi:serine/threonine-protein kinase
MPLQFPNEWRYDDSLGRMPQGAVNELVALIEKVASYAPSAKAVYEAVKHRFGDPNNSSSESWAQSDMIAAMDKGELNTPEFIDAYWSALGDVSDLVPVPPPAKVNAILRQHAVGYIIDPPRLVQEVGAAVIVTPDAPTAPVMPGYTLGERLGGGAFGEVFAAIRRTPFCEFEFAIKFHRPSVFTDAERARSRFEREVVAIGKLQHRAIVAYTDAGIDVRGYPFLVMSLVRGTNLRDATQGKPARVSVRHVTEVLGAISHAHAKGVLHRDLKPANILVRASDSQAVVVDFGLAYVLDELSAGDLTLSGIGTAPYVPYESLVNPKERTFAHDIYSCGVILYELLARTVPDLRDPVKLAKFDPSWAPLDPVVMRALSRVEERYPSAAEFRSDLLRAAAALPQ